MYIFIRINSGNSLGCYHKYIYIYIELIICIKMDMNLNNLHKLICHKTKTAKQNLKVRLEMDSLTK